MAASEIRTESNEPVEIAPQALAATRSLYAYRIADRYPRAGDPHGGGTAALPSGGSGFAGQDLPVQHADHRERVSGMENLRHVAPVHHDAQ